MSTSPPAILGSVRGCKYPCVPGHELAGVVSVVGHKVRKVKVGQRVGVCMVDSCRECAACKAGQEQYCVKQCTGTYNGATKHGRADYPGLAYTLGGYTDKHVCDEDFVIAIPDDYPLECGAGVLSRHHVYDPLKDGVLTSAAR
eukprot:TRINITY_DN6943_c0_g1_i1.p3 TRINITY_DN6943_c0_g1~~TRINITY_DN6943_c0_g1_i1.p3  ORF type:complete len:143 (+),score=20.82 TRINITY_DN6943_c0_g1_i1:433-861(+)